MSGTILISLNDACAMTSLSRTSLNRLRAEGQFPAEVRLTDQRFAFVKAEVEAWVRDRIARRDRRDKAAQAERGAA